MIVRQYGSDCKVCWESTMSSRSAASAYRTPQSSQRHSEQVAVEQPVSPHLVELNKEEKADTHRGKDSNLTKSDRHIEKLLATTNVHQQSLEDLPAGSHHDCDTSIGVDATFKMSMDLHDSSGADDAIEKARPPAVRSNLVENHAILEFAMNAGLLNDDDFVRYQDTISRLEEEEKS